MARTRGRFRMDEIAVDDRRAGVLAGKIRQQNNRVDDAEKRDSIG